jgi:dienelactone hydrolase
VKVRSGIAHPVSKRLACTLVVLALLGGACSDGGDAASDPVPTVAETTTSTAPPAVALDLETTVESPEDLPGYHVYRPADLDAAGRTLPVIAWANGGCLRFDSPWEPLLRALARAGFVVIAIAPFEEDTPLEVGAGTAEHQIAALDWAEAQNGLSGGSYEGRLDTDRMAVAGNSCGGVTSVAAAGRDDRVRAVFVLSGSSAIPGSSDDLIDAAMGAITVPIAYVTGGPEDISRGQIAKDYAALGDGIPAYVASRSEADHLTVSTDVGILTDEVAAIAVNWFDLALYDNTEAATALTDDPCPACAEGTWTVESKNLASLTIG